MADQTDRSQPATPWNKGKLIGHNPPLRLQEIWTVRTRLQMAGRPRELALFNRSTANCVVVSWCACACVMSPMANASSREPA